MLLTFAILSGSAGGYGSFLKQWFYFQGKEVRNSLDAFSNSISLAARSNLEKYESSRSLKSFNLDSHHDLIILRADQLLSSWCPL